MRVPEESFRSAGRERERERERGETSWVRGILSPGMFSPIQYFQMDESQREQHFKLRSYYRRVLLLIIIVLTGYIDIAIITRA